MAIMIPTVPIRLDSTRVRVGNGIKLTLDTSGLALDFANNSYIAVWESRSLGDFEPSGKNPIASIDDRDGELTAVGLTSQNRSIRWVASEVEPSQVTLSVLILDVGQAPGAWTAPRVNNEIQKLVGTRPNWAIVAGNTQQVDVFEPSRQVEVSMRRAHNEPDALQALHTAIRTSTTALSFVNYARFMDDILCAPAIDGNSLVGQRWNASSRRIRLPFPDTDAYRQLKVATEVFMMLNTGADLGNYEDVLAARLADPDELAAESRRYERTVNDPREIVDYWLRLMARGGRVSTDRLPSLLYLALVRNKLRGVEVSNQLSTDTRTGTDDAVIECQAILQEKLTFPTFLELIWSYWHEEGMLVQTMNAITWRFQNRRAGGDRDPLSMIEIDPLRPLNNFIWGYIQDEQHRLTLVRRAYEYDHHYGLTLMGKAVPPVRGADSRTRFIEAFHHLLFLCAIFYKEEDDTTVIADGFPILNALKEVHLLLTQGAHNQYGDLPWTARQEMLMQEWLLARPEFHEFLPRRIMVDYPEEWMDSVETMKAMQGWRSASSLHFRDLGVFGEQILLGIRFGAWPSEIESLVAANWARYWRPEIQGYIHAYRAATGVDLTERIDATPPSLLLQQRLQQQLPAGQRRPIRRVSARPVERAALPWGKTDR
jgi:hypothetical protein